MIICKKGHWQSSYLHEAWWKLLLYEKLLIYLYVTSWYGHQRVDVKGATLLSSVQWWMKKGWSQVTVVVSAFQSLWCFDTDGRVAGRTSGPYSPITLIPRSSLPDPRGNQLTQVHLERWPLNSSSSYLCVTCYIYARLLFYCIIWESHYVTSAFNALTVLVGHQKDHPVCKNWVMRCWCGYLCPGNGPLNGCLA